MTLAELTAAAAAKEAVCDSCDALTANATEVDGLLVCEACA